SPYILAGFLSCGAAKLSRERLTKQQATLFFQKSEAASSRLQQFVNLEKASTKRVQGAGLLVGVR
ncbi:MAG: hypothetical protein V3T83_22920, partial [Acidobacteriota bacterium]